AGFAASGPLGSARLAEIGPVWWSVALVAALLVGVGAVLAAWCARLLAAPPTQGGAFGSGGRGRELG
ncbi:MAG: hypothetical protein ACRDT6_28930, partial [Micromonosporaceae bacterium]